MKKFEKVSSQLSAVLASFTSLLLAACDDAPKRFAPAKWKGGPHGGKPAPGVINTGSGVFHSIGQLLTDGMGHGLWFLGFVLILMLDWIVILAIPGIIVGAKEPRLEAKWILRLCLLILIPACIFQAWGLVMGVFMCNIIPAIVQYIRNKEEGKFTVYGTGCYLFFLIYYAIAWLEVKAHPLTVVGLTVVGIIFTIFLFSLAFGDKKK